MHLTSSHALLHALLKALTSALFANDLKIERLVLGLFPNKAPALIGIIPGPDPTIQWLYQ
jgi:hypothetical protein